MNLLLADDHTLFRDALTQFIERAEPEAKVILAKDLHEVMEIMEGKPAVDLILLDLRMPGMQGLQGLEKIRKVYPDTKVALLSGLAEKEDVEKALALGAYGYFPKTLSGKAMLSGIHKIIAGEKYLAVDHNNDEIMPSYYNDNSGNYGGMSDMAQAPLEKEAGHALTKREKEVLGFLLRGASNKEIARALDLQVVTVKLHVRGVCRKLGAKNRTQAALMAQKLGIDPAGQ